MIDAENSKSGLIKIYYFSKWNSRPSIHLSFDGNQWSTVKMDECKHSINLFKIKIPNCFSLSFVFCGKNASLDQQTWDNPSNYCNYKFREGDNFKIRKDGCYAIFDHKVFQVRWQGQKLDPQYFVLTTRLTNVLLGDDEQLAYFQQYWIENYFFARNSLLIFCIPESFDWFINIFHKYPLLLPDFLITASGCNIYSFKEQQLEVLFQPKLCKEFDIWLQDKKQILWEKDYIIAQLEEYQINVTFAENGQIQDQWNLKFAKNTKLEELFLFQDLLKNQNIFIQIVENDDGYQLMPINLSEKVAVQFIQDIYSPPKTAFFGYTEEDYHNFKNFIHDVIIVNNSNLQSEANISSFKFGAALKFYLEEDC